MLNCIFGCITNAINISVFMNSKFKDKIFDYLLLMSMSEFIYLLLIIFMAIPFAIYGSIDSGKFTMYYKFYVDDYFTSCLAIFNLFIEISISFHRYLIVSNKKFCSLLRNRSPYLVSFILFTISIIFYSPEVILREINFNYTTNIHKIKERSTYHRYFNSILQFFRGPICFVGLFTINLMTLSKFQAQMKSKNRMRRNAPKGILILIFKFIQ
jgi:hypothetical protein